MGRCRGLAGALTLTTGPGGGPLGTPGQPAEVGGSPSEHPVQTRGSSGTCLHFPSQCLCDTEDGNFVAFLVAQAAL